MRSLITKLAQRPESNSHQEIATMFTHSSTLAHLVSSVFLCITIHACLSSHAVSFVPWDISASYNYDAVGTADEIAANPPGLLSNNMGDHGLDGYNQRCYTNLDSVSGAVALPDGGVLGNYSISSAFDNGTDYLTKEDNAVAVETDNSASVFSQTITLPPSEQGNYTGFNILFVSSRDGNNSNYRSWITATYTDSTSTIVVDTGTGGGSGPGGTFGGAGRGSQGGLLNLTDNYTFVNQAPGTGETVGSNLVLGMDRLVAISGSSSAIRSGDAAIWEFSSPIALDMGGTLESLTVNLQRAGVNRNHSLYILGITGTIPEPATATVLGLGCLGLLCRSGRGRRDG